MHNVAKESAPRLNTKTVFPGMGIRKFKIRYTLETRQEIVTVSNHPLHEDGHTSFWYVCLLERVYFDYQECCYNVWYVWYIIHGVHRPKPRSSGGNTSSNPLVSALIPRPAFNGMERMCQRQDISLFCPHHTHDATRASGSCYIMKLHLINWPQVDVGGDGCL